MKKETKRRQLICECGGRLLPATLARYDFSPYVGFEVSLVGMDGLKCDKCGGESLDGAMINKILVYLVVKIAEQPRRLNGSEARHLRRHLGFTQEELATKMGIIRGTVAKWEGDGEISVQNDYILRVFALTTLIAQGILPADYARELMARTFGAVQQSPPESVTMVAVSRADLNRVNVAAAG